MAGLLIRALKEKKAGSILAVDGDPNSTLPEILGVENPDTIVGIVDGIVSYKLTVPAGMTKDRFVDLKIQESLAEEDGFDLLVMGRPEGSGCYCYANNLLRGLIERLTKSYDFVVIDNEAGMEHISRRTTKVADRLLLVSDYSAFGIRSAGRIYRLAQDIGMKIGKASLIINRADGDAGIFEDEIRATKLPLIGVIPQSEDIVSNSVQGKTIFELKSEKIDETIEGILNKILEVPA